EQVKLKHELLQISPWEIKGDRGQQVPVAEPPGRAVRRVRGCEVERGEHRERGRRERARGEPTGPRTERRRREPRSQSVRLGPKPPRSARVERDRRDRHGADEHVDEPRPAAAQGQVQGRERSDCTELEQERRPPRPPDQKVRHELRTGNDRRRLPAAPSITLAQSRLRGCRTGTKPAVLRHSGRNGAPSWTRDRKSTRLNSSHVKISYAVFCLKK